MYQVGICSRDVKIINLLERFILDRYRIKVYKYVSENELWREMMNGTGCTDILIMDIEQSKGDISLAKSVQEKNKRIKIIFVAGNMSEAINIFETEPTYLLLKPLEKRNVYCAMDRAICKLQKGGGEVLKLYFKDKLICIPCQEILYIESDRRYITIYQENRTDRAMMKMSEIMKMLPEYFVRCHQSYAINIHKMVKFEKSSIMIKHGNCIAVSRNRFEETKRVIQAFYGEGKNLPKIT